MKDIRVRLCFWNRPAGEQLVPAGDRMAERRTRQQSWPPCPTDEEIAAFLDGGLAAGERARITAHLAGCESCFEVFAGAAGVLAEQAPRG
jgi:hypothetical protein